MYQQYKKTLIVCCFGEKEIQNLLKNPRAAKLIFDDDPFLPSNISINFLYLFIERDAFVIYICVNQWSFGQRILVSCDHFQKLGIAKFLSISALQKK